MPAVLSFPLRHSRQKKSPHAASLLPCVLKRQRGVGRVYFVCVLGSPCGGGSEPPITRRIPKSMAHPARARVCVCV